MSKWNHLIWTCRSYTSFAVSKLFQFFQLSKLFQFFPCRSYSSFSKCRSYSSFYFFHDFLKNWNSFDTEKLEYLRQCVEAIPATQFDYPKDIIWWGGGISSTFGKTGISTTNEKPEYLRHANWKKYKNQNTFDNLKNGFWYTVHPGKQI